MASRAPDVGRGIDETGRSGGRRIRPCPGGRARGGRGPGRRATGREPVACLGEADLDRIVDDAWDPPVTLGVRLVSVLSDDLQHAGQAAYVRGLVLRDT
ncbi:hypothetical protein B1H26_24895 [Amycolatopsis sp. BJA-103]|nr:DUF664 domain-containing protein [Amycolatopsis sp. BJA-103]PNE16494.1 hypothetical protein B1H26_24895 [Amycolatopsis sp. BJA-103]